MEELPPPDYFTVSELAEYFTQKYGKCTPVTIHRYIFTDLLRPAFCFKSLECIYTQEKFIDMCSEDLSAEELNEFEDDLRPASWSGIFTLAEGLTYLLEGEGYPMYVADGVPWKADIKGHVFTNSSNCEIIPQESMLVSALDMLITLDEVRRFESECMPKAATPEHATTQTPTMGIDETPENYTKRRRAEGAKNTDIAWEVYRETSSLEKVGRIFHPDPPTTEPTTYTHRGKKILGLK